MPLRWVGGEGSQVPQPTLRSQLENLTTYYHTKLDLSNLHSIDFAVHLFHQSFARTATAENVGQEKSSIFL